MAKSAGISLYELSRYMGASVRVSRPTTPTWYPTPKRLPG
jgi:hypothetical protein